jgi:hypothetical protein
MGAVGVYSVDNSPESKAIREDVMGIVMSHKEVVQAHGFRVDQKNKVINLDIVIDYGIKDRMSMFQQICKEIQEKYPDYRLELILDIDV